MAGLRARSVVIGALLGLGAAAGAGIALRPGSYRVERSVHVEAPAAAVAGPIRDLERWLAWSEREAQDPGARRVHGGPEAGPGASLFWTASDDRGGGRLTLLSSGPDRWVLEREIGGAPGTIADIEIALAPDAGGTRVTWTESGRIPLLHRLLPVGWRADGALPGVIDRSLARLASVAEAESRVVVDEVERDVHSRASPGDIQAALADVRRWPEFWPLPAGSPEARPIFFGTPGVPGSSGFWLQGESRDRITLISASPDRVVVELERGPVGPTTSDVSFRLVPDGAGTRIVATASAPASRDLELALERLAVLGTAPRDAD